MWVEVLLALMVEGYREFMKWWQARASPPAVRADDVSGGARVAAEQGASDVDRTGLVAETVGWILDRHARKHVGIAVGVLWQGERWTFARGRPRATPNRV
jgi:hypothetical protein